jgi:hypothetical protein
MLWSSMFVCLEPPEVSDQWNGSNEHDYSFCGHLGSYFLNLSYQGVIRSLPQSKLQFISVSN